jgi:HSP20 family protein
MALVRWQPTNRTPSRVRNRRDDVESFFEDFFGYHPPRYVGSPSNTFTPRLNLKDTPEAYILRVELPGFEREQIDLTINSDLVTLKGERKEEPEAENECYYCRESQGGSFERSIQLPQPVVADKAEAKLQDGVLTVTLPKEQQRKSVTISVN